MKSYVIFCGYFYLDLTHSGNSSLHCDTLTLHDNEEAIAGIALQGWLNVETERHED